VFGVKALFFLSSGNMNNLRTHTHTPTLTPTTHTIEAPNAVIHPQHAITPTRSHSSQPEASRFRSRPPAPRTRPLRRGCLSVTAREDGGRTDGRTDGCVAASSARERNPHAAPGNSIGTRCLARAGAGFCFFAYFVQNGAASEHGAGRNGRSQGKAHTRVLVGTGSLLIFIFMFLSFSFPAFSVHMKRTAGSG